MKERPSLHALALFLATVEHGTMTAAAEAEGIAQPAISVHIRNLERFYATPLGSYWHGTPDASWVRSMSLSMRWRILTAFVAVAWWWEPAPQWQRPGYPKCSVAFDAPTQRSNWKFVLATANRSSMKFTNDLWDLASLAGRSTTQRSSPGRSSRIVSNCSLRQTAHIPAPLTFT